jgi:hypothetical protein
MSNKWFWLILAVILTGGLVILFVGGYFLIKLIQQGQAQAAQQQLNLQNAQNLQGLEGLGNQILSFF